MPNRRWRRCRQCNACGLQGKIKSLEQIYLFSLPVKEYQIVENFLGSALKDEVMKIMPVQKQTRAGQRTRFKVCSRTTPKQWSTSTTGQHNREDRLIDVLHAHAGLCGCG